MKVQKVWAWLLTLSLVLAFLTACSEKPAGSAPEDSENSSASAEASEFAPEDPAAPTVLPDGSTTGGAAGGTTGTVITRKPATTASKPAVTLPGVTAATRKDIDKVDLSGKVSDLKGRTIKFQVLSQTNTSSSDPEWAKALKGFAMVEKKYNCKIEIVKCDMESNGDTRLLNSMLAGQPMADILVQDQGSFYSRYRAGLLQNLSILKAIDFESNESCFPAWGTACMVDGAYYAFMVDDGGGEMTFAPVVVYNKKLLEEFAPQYANAPWQLYKSGNWTWDEFAKICDAFNRGAKSRSDMTACWDGGAMMYQSMLITAGTDWLKYDSKMNVLFNGRNAKAQEVLNKYTSLVKAGTVMLGRNPSNVADALYGDMEKKLYSFKNGQTAFAVATFNDGYYWYGMNASDTQQSVKDNMGVLPLPKWNKSDSYSFAVPLSVRGTSIPAGVKKPKEVATVLYAIFGETEGNFVGGWAESSRSYVDKWYAATFNAKMGKQNREIAELIYGSFRSHKNIVPYLGNVGEATDTNIRYGINDEGVATGWFSKYVYEIANGNMAQSAALDAVEKGFNNELKKLTTVR